MRMPTLTMMTMVLGLAASSVQAREPALFKRFYAQKRSSTTPEAYARAVDNLGRVRGGMSEAEFLEVMKMEVLRNGKEFYDARIDGYLPKSSREANAVAQPGARILLFGYVAGGKELQLRQVTLHDHRVVEIRSLPSEPLTAQANLPGGKS